MGKIMAFLRDEENMQKYYFGLALIFVVGLVFQDMSKLPMTAALSLSSFFVLISGNWSAKWKRLKARPVILFLLAYYFLHWVGMSYSEDLDLAGRILSLKVSLLLFGVVWSVVDLTVDQIKKVLVTFVLACFIASVFDLFLALLRYLESGDIVEFLYHKLSVIFPNKKNYLSIYYTFSAFIMIAFAIRPPVWLKVRWVYIFAIVWFTAMVLLLGARAQLLSMLIVGPVLFMYYFKGRISSWKIWLGAIAFFTLLSAVIIVNPVTRPKVVESVDELKQLLSPDGGKNTNPRIYIWDYGMAQISQQSILFGAGTGDAVHELQTRMQDCEIQFWLGDGYYLLRDKNLNYHNEYMEALATLGIPALLLLVLVIILPLLRHKNQSQIFLMFILLMMISFLTESALERQAGLLFFAFFYPFLLQRKLN